MQHESRGRFHSTHYLVHEVYRRKVWESRIPVQITVDDEELQRYLPREQFEEQARMARTRPFFAMLPRISYFPLLMTQLRKHYSELFSRLQARKVTITPWLECRGRPLAWHYAIGHLYDEHVCWSSPTNEGMPSCPWEIVLHFSEFPKSIIPFASTGNEEGSGSGPIAAHYYSMLKQADYLRHGSCKGVNGLSKSEQTQLWDGIWTHSYDKFWRVAHRLLGEDPARSWRYLPCRFYSRSDSGPRQVYQSMQSPADCHTLNDLLARSASDHHHPSNIKGVVIHGIEMPLETPLSWLALYFTFPDGFLHLILV